MMPGAVTPLTLSTSVKAIDYGIRHFLAMAGVYKSACDQTPLRLISSISGHLFFDMNLVSHSSMQNLLASIFHLPPSSEI